MIVSQEFGGSDVGVAKIDRIRSGLAFDPEADGYTSRLDGIAARYYQQLINFFRRHGESVEEAADLAQDTFARLSAADLSQVRSPGPFLYTTARNLVKDRARSATHRVAAMSVAMVEDDLVSPNPDSERIYAAKEQLAILEKALAELNPKCRAVLVLYRFDELSHAEIADRLGISVSMVEKYVRRALRHCQLRLEEAGRDRPGAWR